MVCVGSRETREAPPPHTPSPPPATPNADRQLIGLSLSWRITGCYCIQETPTKRVSLLVSPQTSRPMDASTVNSLFVYLVFSIRTDATIWHKQQTSAPDNWAAVFSSSSHHHCLVSVAEVTAGPSQLLTVSLCSTDVLRPPVWAAVSCSCAQDGTLMLIWAV